MTAPAARSLERARPHARVARLMASPSVPSPRRRCRYPGDNPLSAPRFRPRQEGRWRGPDVGVTPQTRKRMRTRTSEPVTAEPVGV
jgi:hypothetical protein